MSREPLSRLHDIIEACGAIAAYIEGLDAAEFSQDSKTQDAVIRQFEIVGEAAKYLPDPWKGEEPDIPWSRICGFRDVLSHGYFSIEISVVWDAAAHKAPLLKEACGRLLERHRPGQ